MMEKLVLNLTLQEIMIRKVVIHLWSIDESFDLFLLQSFRLAEDELRSILPTRSDILLGNIWPFENEPEELREATERVKVKITELGLPASLEKKMMLVVKPIGLEMIRGKVMLLSKYLSDSRSDVDLQILKQLCWTNAGQVDYQMTAENVLRLETLDVVKRFRFACLNFLEDHIPDLWKALPEEYQKCFDDEKSPLRISMTHDEDFWYRTLKGKQPEMGPSMGFESLPRANKAEIKYWFQRLSQVDRDSCLCPFVCEVARARFDYLPSLRFFPTECLSGVLFYLLSQMSPEEQKQVFQGRACYVLACFLDWPLQDLLPDIANVVWPYISDDYDDLYCNVRRHFRSSRYYFPDVFQKFFLCSPVIFRKFFFECDDTFISEFVKTKNVDTIVVMLRSFDVEERMEVMTSSDVFNDLVDGDCDFIKLCLRGALECAEDRERARRAFADRPRYREIYKYRCNEERWKEVLESLEDDASVVNKRSSDEKASTRVKRPRTRRKRRRRN